MYDIHFLEKYQCLPFDLFCNLLVFKDAASHSGKTNLPEVVAHAEQQNYWLCGSLAYMETQITEIIDRCVFQWRYCEATIFLIIYCTCLSCACITVFSHNWNNRKGNRTVISLSHCCGEILLHSPLQSCFSSQWGLQTFVHAQLSYSPTTAFVSGLGLDFNWTIATLFSFSDILL